MKVELKYAVIYAFASLIWSFVEYFSGLQSSRIALHPYFVTPFSMLLTSVVYYLTLREKRTHSEGELGFGKALVSGLMLTLFIVILHVIPFYVFNTFINPDFFPAMARHKVETENMVPAVAEGYYSFSNLLFQGTIYRAVMGVVATVLAALFLRRRSS